MIIMKDLFQNPSHVYLGEEDSEITADLIDRLIAKRDNVILNNNLCIHTIFCHTRHSPKIVELFNINIEKEDTIYIKNIGSFQSKKQ